MSELRALVDATAPLRRAGKEFVVATLVSVKGSSYRRPGARLLIADDGNGAARWTVGSISGGCLEGDLVRRAWWRTDNGGPALVTYDSSADEDDLGWGMGLGCNGVVELLLERVRPVGGQVAGLDPLAFIGGCIDDERPGALVTVFRAPRGDLPLGTCLAIRAGDEQPRSMVRGPEPHAMLLREARAALQAPAACAETITFGTGAEALVEVVRPPPHLFVFGAGPDAVPVVRAARSVGWTVTVWAPRGRAQAALPFAEAHHICTGPARAMRAAMVTAHRPVAVVMSHNFSHDAEALAALLVSPCLYVGLLGPRRRADKLLAELPGSLSLGDPRIRHWHAPVGLAIGAETPDEVALSIIAEAQAVLAQQAAGYLRDRSGPIHAADAAPAVAVAATGE